MDFHVLGGQKTNKKTKKWNEIGQMLVYGALDDTKTIRKTAADIFAKSGPEKTKKKTGQIQMFSGLFLMFIPFSRGISLQFRKSTCERLGAILSIQELEKDLNVF